jgi:thiol:disulfide interchange protein DsbA
MVILLLLPTLLFAKTTTDENFEAGKNYVLVNTKNVAPIAQDGKVHVVEFFSLGCPWCFRLEPSIEEWLKHKAKNVDFQRVPVIWNNVEWELLAKAYFTADALGKADKLVPAMFDAIHKKNITFNSPADVQKFFATQGVKEKDFSNAFNFSPNIDTRLVKSKDLVQSYAVVAIPALIVNGKYMTNATLNGGDAKKLMQVLSFLIKKEEKTNGKK